jgi:hypothetical protein
MQWRLVLAVSLLIGATQQQAEIITGSYDEVYVDATFSSNEGAFFGSEISSTAYGSVSVPVELECPKFLYQGS